MRIVAGTMRGRRLVAPPGRDTRPTSDRVREAIFAILGPIDGVAVLDLFAGSGAMALEALSRGAASAVCIDSARAAVTAIEHNAAMLDDPAVLHVRRGDWRAALRAEARAGGQFRLCLIDPPYSLLPRITGGLADVLLPVLAPQATIVIEGAASEGPVEVAGLPIAHRTDRTYGGTSISIIRIGASE